MRHRQMPPNTEPKPSDLVCPKNGDGEGRHAYEPGGTVCLACRWDKKLKRVVDAVASAPEPPAPPHEQEGQTEDWTHAARNMGEVAQPSHANSRQTSDPPARAPRPRAPVPKSKGRQPGAVSILRVPRHALAEALDLSPAALRVLLAPAYKPNADGKPALDINAFVEAIARRWLRVSLAKSDAADIAKSR